jgi:hypothetical protein
MERRQAMPGPENAWRTGVWRGAVAVIARALLLGGTAAASPALQALSALPDEELGTVTGTGMAFSWEDFRWMTDPTSFVEQTGSGVDPASGFQRGDLRWYGLNTTATGAGTTWTESGGDMVACASQGINGLGCPRGGPITDFAAHDNPYVLRVHDYTGTGASATDVNGPLSAGVVADGIVDYQGDYNASQTVLELLAPTAQDDYRFSFWGEIEVGKNPLAGTNNGLLKTQTLIQGNAAGSIIRLFQFTQPGNETLALIYHSRLRGDFRFSAAQTETTPALGTPVAFDANEGLHFRNVDAYVPLGQLYYQALTVDVPRCTGINQPVAGCSGAGAPITNGNYVLEMPRLPNTAAVYTRFYTPNSASLPSGADSTGFVTARMGLLGADGDVHANYDLTHGWSRWGNWFPCQGSTGGAANTSCPNPPTSVPAGRNAWNSTDDGIFFRKCTGCGNFRAMSYRYTRVDVRAGNNQYDGVQRMNTYSACTPTSGSPWQCGYGGATAASAGALTSTQCSTANQPNNAGMCTSGTSIQNHMDPVRYTNTTIPMVTTPVANLGDSRIEGMIIQSFRFTSYGAQY